MHRLAVFIRLSDWPLSKYEEQLRQLIDQPFAIDSIYITHDGYDRFEPAQINDLLHFLHYAEKTEITLEIKPDLLSTIQLPDSITRLSLMDCQAYDEATLLPLLTLRENINIDWNFSDRFNAQEIERFLDINAPHKAVYGIDDQDEFAQIKEKLIKNSLKPYDDFHFCKQGYECRYLKITNSAQGQWLGIGPNAASHLLD